MTTIGTTDQAPQADVGAEPAAAPAPTSCSCCAPRLEDRTAIDTADAATTRALVDGVQEVRVTVQGGYTPATVRLVRGVPARLVFDRQETAGCSAELLIPALGIRRDLPAHAETLVEFTPTEIGTMSFTCGMRMLRGELVVG